MFYENTVFILGAGASFPYGYPTGKGLIQKIKHSIKNDKIILLHNEPFSKSCFKDLMAYLDNFNLSKINDVEDSKLKNRESWYNH